MWRFYEGDRNIFHNFVTRKIAFSKEFYPMVSMALKKICFSLFHSVPETLLYEITEQLFFLVHPVNVITCIMFNYFHISVLLCSDSNPCRSGYLDSLRGRHVELNVQYRNVL